MRESRAQISNKARFSIPFLLYSRLQKQCHPEHPPLESVHPTLPAVIELHLQMTGALTKRSSPRERLDFGTSVTRLKRSKMPGGADLRLSQISTSSDEVPTYPVTVHSLSFSNLQRLAKAERETNGKKELTGPFYDFGIGSS